MEMTSCVQKSDMSMLPRGPSEIEFACSQSPVQERAPVSVAGDMKSNEDQCFTS